MFKKPKIYSSNDWKSQSSDFQCLDKPKFTIPIIGKDKIQNTNLWKSQNSEFQCLEIPKFEIPMFGKAKK